MVRRLYQTTADYVVLALSPALVMALVGSLVFFLLAVFYQGAFAARLHWVMACFVFAAVLIARISIEEGLERAMPFGIALAVVVGIAANEFMNIQGSWIDSISWLINWGLIALVWWCAHKLTWDCTVIDDSQDASGEGLLQLAGLEGSEATAAETAIIERRLEGTTSRAVYAGWWQRYVEHQRRPHAPGVWVIYFSLAALPLFGIGQWFIPESNLWGRRYAFWLLAVYVASGMGLLLTTSFLGLRRYLRQRRIEMPATMSGLWLSTGAGLIVLLLVFAMLLPRPSAEYAVSELPFSVGSPEQRPSRAAPVPEEGVRDEQQGTAPDDQPPKEDEPPANEDGPVSVAKGTQENPETRQGSGSAERQESQSSKQGGQGDKSSKGSQRSNNKSSQQQQQQDQGSQSKDSAGDNQKQVRESSDSKASKDARQSKAKSDTAEPPENTASEPKESHQADQKQSDSTPEPNSPPTSSPQMPQLEPPAVLSTAAGAVGQILQWVFYAVVALATLYMLWRSRSAVLAAIREFLRGIAELLANLLGGRRARAVSAEDAARIEVPPAPFASFADPFATGVASRYSTEELVRYTFEAFEAWAREHGCPRHADQTPHELARSVGKRHASMLSDVRTLTDLYSRAAYDRGAIPPGSTDPLRRLWQRMRSAAPAAWE